MTLTTDSHPVAATETSCLPLVRTRVALALVSLVGVALELTFMRGLALRFWSHLACMVISVGLLGFGTAGTFLTLLRPFFLRRQRECLVAVALLLALAIPLTWWASQVVPLNVKVLAWTPSECWHVLGLELLMFAPFFFVGAFVGIVLMDLPRRISGHYASDLLGSGIGAIAAVLAMNVLSTIDLVYALTAGALAAGCLLVPWRSRRALVGALGAITAAVALLAALPREPAISSYMALYTYRLLPSYRLLYHSEGPLGRIDVVAADELHYAPQLSLNYYEDWPRTAVIVTDADGVSPLYDARTPHDFEFLDYRSAALAFHLVRDPRVCIIGAGGGGEIGLACYHQSPAITALEMNPQVIAAMTGPLASRGGSIYTAPGVEIVNQEARGFFAGTTARFDIIQLPAIDGFGAAGSGIYASQESYLYTVESMRAMLRHLSDNGILSVTRWERPPARLELRAVDMIAQALKAEGLDPRTHLVVIRSTFSLTILAMRHAVTDADMAATRAFCKPRCFDLCYLPGQTLSEAESNRFFRIEGNPYVTGIDALLGPDRANFIASYPFDIAAPTDDKPYYFHTLRLGAIAGLRDKYGAGANAFLETGYLMLLAALLQTAALGALLVLVPLAPGLRALRGAPGKLSSLTYFLMLGIGFMLLEMGFMQKLVLYLAHPIYAASVVLASFLLFAGLGSHLAGRWTAPARRTIAIAAGVTVALAALYLLGLDRWLAMSASLPVAARCVIAAITIGPLAFAMGHFFPLGLTQTARCQPAMVPWAWAINGFASVTATAAAPALAMRVGFTAVVLVAMLCYLLAGCVFQAMKPARA